MASCGYTKYRRFHHVLGIACVWAPVGQEDVELSAERREVPCPPGAESLGRSSIRRWAAIPGGFAVE